MSAIHITMPPGHGVGSEHRKHHDGIIPNATYGPIYAAHNAEASVECIISGTLSVDHPEYFNPTFENETCLKGTSTRTYKLVNPGAGKPVVAIFTFLYIANNVLETDMVTLIIE